MDQGADGMSLAAPMSSPTNSLCEDTAAKGPGEGATDQTADGMSLATPASSLNNCRVETSMDSDETTNKTTAPLSLLLEGERDIQVMSSSTRAHSEGAESPDSAVDAQDDTQCQSARTAHTQANNISV
ncbi:hypothetical protein BU15DRAFT_68728 [Melanogaster broomeanus]|nr:hypothetical protein BU15DRAFT_68728 [Melanogaster broomeanus]